MRPRVAAVLNALAEDIERLATVLCADPDICNRHLDALQDIDRIAQLQRGLAAIVGHSDPHDAIAASGLDSLRHAFKDTHPSSADLVAGAR